MSLCGVQKRVGLWGTCHGCGVSSSRRLQTQGLAVLPRAGLPRAVWLWSLGTGAAAPGVRPVRLSGLPSLLGFLGAYL